NDYDAATALGVSPDGSAVFVTGFSYEGYPDYATVAYDASTGAQLWVMRYDGGVASALGVSIDGSAVFVTGGTDVGFNDDYVTISYDASTGAELWLMRYDGPASDSDHAYALQVSPDGASVFVTGGSYGLGST